jgi:hypothetical protein
VGVMAEYIEREAAKKEFALNFGSVSHAVIANRLLDSIPAADVVPVVRCKDCKNYRLFWNMFGVEISRCMLFGADVGMEAFCSYGKRKDGE